MFCYNCGIKVDDNVRFCPNCGTKLANEQPEPQPKVEPIAEPVIVVRTVEPIVVPNLQSETPEYVPSVEEKTKACVKKSLSSALFLIATILFTLSVVLGMISFAMGSETEVYSEPGIFDKVSVSDGTAEDDFDGVLEFLDIFDVGILWVVGLWLTFAFAKSKKDMNTGGIAVLKVAARIEVILSFIIATVLLIVGIVLSVVEEDPTIAVIAVLIAIPVFAAIGFVYVFYCFKVSADISSLYSIASTGIPTAKLSRLVGIVCLVIAGIDLMGTSGNWADILYSLTEGAAYLLFGISFFIFKKKIKGLAEEYKLANTPAPAGQTIINNNVMI